METIIYWRGASILSNNLNHYYRELRTMTRWHKVDDTFIPMDEWRINREIDDVRANGFFSGPFAITDCKYEYTPT